MLYQVGDTHYVGALFLDSSAAGVTGLSPIVHIRRASDGMFWTGAGFNSTPTDLAMSEVSATNAPGEYLYTFTPSAAGQYLGTCFENDTGTYTTEGPVQPFEVYFGISWVELVDIAISSRASANSVAALNDLSTGDIANLIAVLENLLITRSQLTTTTRVKIPYATDLWVQIVAPVDEANNNPLDNTNDGATASFKVFDPNKDSIITADEAGAQTTLSVANAAVLEISDTVEITLDDDTIHSSTIDAVDPSAGTIDIADPLPSQASTGSRVKIRLGSTVTMNEYGTPQLNKRNWGFRGLLSDTHPGLDLGVSVDIEATLVGGADLNRLFVLQAVVSAQASQVRTDSNDFIVPKVTV